MGGVIGLGHGYAADFQDTVALLYPCENETVVWDNNNAKPFGNSTPDQDPDGDGQDVGLDHRFLGQYYGEYGSDATVDKLLAFKYGHGWIEGKWQTLKLNQHISDDIEFNDELWNLVRIMI